jgi:hypothetical protein
MAATICIFVGFPYYPWGSDTAGTVAYVFISENKILVLQNFISFIPSTGKSSLSL